VLGFVVRRAASAILVLFAISVLVFVIFFATPGVDPAARIAGRNADQATLAQVRHSFGLDRPLPVQYALMMRHLFIDRDLESFVTHRRNLFRLSPRLHPVLAKAIASMTQKMDHAAALVSETGLS